MTHVITGGCCNDAGCVDVCPVDSIHPGPAEPGFARTEMLYIDPATCIDCGACIDVCPVSAIKPDHGLSADDQIYLDVNAAFFATPTTRTATTTAPEPDPSVDTAAAMSATRSASPSAPPRPRRPRNRRLRVAIIGSGPAGCYAAEQFLAARDVDVEISLFERLPTPFGLVRYGVAPDHQGTKSVTTLFTRTLRDPRLRLHLGVEVGDRLRIEDLLQHHDAVVVATGATGDRRLGIPGEELPGSHSAREFVAWYNAHPDAHLDADPDSQRPEKPDWKRALASKRAMIVGNGNVALDAARLLTMPPSELAKTDVPTAVAQALADSRIREVVVLGRRGPDAAAFTGPELLNLTRLDWVDIEVRPNMPDWHPQPTDTWKQALLHRIAEHPRRSGLPRIVLQFNTTPLSVLGTEQVSGLRVDQQGTESTIDAGLLLRSIGYRGTPFPGLGFDEARGTLPHDRGRVLVEPGGEPQHGVYTTGWLKRGPSGVIGTNRACAAETVAAVLADFAAGGSSAPAHSADHLEALLDEQFADRLDLASWSAIDRHEQLAGHAAGRPRIKLLTREVMAQAAAGSTAHR